MTHTRTLAFDVIGLIFVQKCIWAWSSSLVSWCDQHDTPLVFVPKVVVARCLSHCSNFACNKVYCPKQLNNRREKDTCSAVKSANRGSCSFEEKHSNGLLRFCRKLALFVAYRDGTCFVPMFPGFPSSVSADVISLFAFLHQGSICDFCPCRPRKQQAVCGLFVLSNPVCYARHYDSCTLNEERKRSYPEASLR